jgi:hypothetical protein
MDYGRSTTTIQTLFRLLTQDVYIHKQNLKYRISAFFFGPVFLPKRGQKPFFLMNYFWSPSSYLLMCKVFIAQLASKIDCWSSHRNRLKMASHMRGEGGEGGETGIAVLAGKQGRI